MIRIKKYYQRGLPVALNQEFHSIDSFIQFVEGIYQSHCKSGSSAGCFVNCEFNFGLFAVPLQLPQFTKKSAILLLTFPQAKIPRKS